MYRWGFCQCSLLVLCRKGSLDSLVFSICLELGKKRLPEIRVIQNSIPAFWSLIDAVSEQKELGPLWMPNTSADKASTGLAMDVVAGVWAFPAGTGPGRREMRLLTVRRRDFSSGHWSNLVWRGVLAKPSVSVDSE